MDFIFRTCELEMDYEAYMKFLFEHDSELNLPYKFNMKLSFMASPLFLGKAMLVFSEEPYVMVGAVGYVYGTGANDHQDRHVCQVEVAFIREDYRRTRLFAQGLRELVKLIRRDNPEADTFQFWIPAADASLQRLFAKLGALPGATLSPVNEMTLCKVPFTALESYSRRIHTA
jgi:hypothetical protein